MSMIYVVHKHELGEGSTIIGATTDGTLAEKLAAATSCSDIVTEITPVPVVVEVSGLTADELDVLRAVERAKAIDPAHLSDIPFLIKEGLLALGNLGAGYLGLTLTTQGRFALECAKPDELKAAPQGVPDDLF